MMHQIFSLIMLCLISIYPTHSQNLDELKVITPNNLMELVELPVEQDILIPARKLVFYPSNSPLDLYEGFQITENFRYPIALLDDKFLNKTITVLNVEDLVLSPDRTLAAVVHHLNEIQILDIHQNHMIFNLKIETNGEPLNTIAIDSQNRYLAVSVGGSVLYPESTSIFQLFDLSSGEILLSLDRLTSNADEIYGSGVTFDSQGDYVYLSTSDGVIRRWNILSKEMDIIGSEAEGNYNTIVYQTSSQTLSSLTSQGFQVISDNGVVDEFVVDSQLDQLEWWRMVSIASHPSESLIAITYIVPMESSSDINSSPTSLKSIVQIWNIETGELGFETYFIESQAGNVIDIAFNSDGTLLGVVSTDGTVRLWGIPAGE